VEYEAWEEADEWYRALTFPRVDIQAAIGVISRRPKARIMAEQRAGLFLNLSGANLQKANLQDADLSHASLSKARLEGANLCGSSFESAWMYETHLELADLSDARLISAYLGGVHLEAAALGGASLDNASLDDGHLEGAFLEGATFSNSQLWGANFRYCSGLAQAQIETAFGDERTILPEGLTQPTHWPQRPNLGMKPD